MGKKNKNQPTRNHIESFQNSLVKIENGLEEALLGFSPLTIGAELSQLTTFFKNLRYILLSNNRVILSQTYVEHGLIQAMIDVPVHDALRGGIKIKSSQLDEDDIKKLQIAVKRDGILQKVVGQALKWMRLFGGSAVMILTPQKADTPLDIGAIGPKTKLKFKAVDMWELFYDQQDTELHEVDISEKQVLKELEFYNYYGKNIHKSRVMIMKGLTAPSFLRARLRGWGMSVLEPVVRDMNQYLKANDLIFEVLDEFKLDIFKIKGLTSTLAAANGTQKIQNRVAMANRQKNYQNALTMDAEDDYMQKQLSFSGLAEVMTGIRMQIASSLRMPLTKLFGISAAGFSSGEDDIENYNAMIESEIREKCEFDILRILEIMCQQLFGFVPDDLEIEFESLRTLTSEQEQNVKDKKFARICLAYDKGLMPVKDWKDAVNKDDLLGVQLDPDSDALPPPGGGGDDLGDLSKDGESAAKPKEGKKSATEPKAAKNSMGIDNDADKIENPGKVDEAKWAKAKAQCQKEYGKLRYAVVTSIYKKMGGTFR